jgi:hypothetical protein
MCHAWLLRSRHGPDGARAHTGYAYGHSARAELRPRPRCTHKLGLALGPPSRRSAARGKHRAAWSHNYTPSAEGACEVTRPHGSISRFGEEGGKRPTVRTTEKCGARFGWRPGTKNKHTNARNMSGNSPRDLATHQGDPQHKGSPRPRLLSLPRRGRSRGHIGVYAAVGEGTQRVRQTGATAYLLIRDTGVPVPLLEVCDVSVIRFAQRQAGDGMNATGQPSTTSVCVGATVRNGRRVRQGLFRFILVKGRLRRLCTSNLGFDHSRFRQHQLTAPPRRGATHSSGEGLQI